MKLTDPTGSYRHLLRWEVSDPLVGTAWLESVRLERLELLVAMVLVV